MCDCSRFFGSKILAPLFNVLGPGDEMRELGGIEPPQQTPKVCIMPLYHNSKKQFNVLQSTRNLWPLPDVFPTSVHGLKSRVNQNDFVRFSPRDDWWTAAYPTGCQRGGRSWIAEDRGREATRITKCFLSETTDVPSHTCFHSGNEVVVWAPRTGGGKLLGYGDVT